MMPTYDFKCPNDHVWEHARTIGERNAPAFCPTCGQEGKRIYLKPPVLAWYPDSTRPPYKR